MYRNSTEKMPQPMCSHREQDLRFVEDPEREGNPKDSKGQDDQV